MADIAHNFTKDQMASTFFPSFTPKADPLQAKGIAEPSFTSAHLEGNVDAETEFLIKWTALSMYGGKIPFFIYHRRITHLLSVKKAAQTRYA